jgi:hypothetical protein
VLDQRGTSQVLGLTGQALRVHDRASSANVRFSSITLVLSFDGFLDSLRTDWEKLNEISA